MLDEVVSLQRRCGATDGRGGGLRFGAAPWAGGSQLIEDWIDWRGAGGGGAGGGGGGAGGAGSAATER